MSQQTQSAVTLDPYGAELIQQGAEARIYKGTFLSLPCIIKQRFPKAYRHPLLDQKLLSRRHTQEARSILRCSKVGIDVPTLYHVDSTSHTLIMEHIAGHTVKHTLAALQRQQEEEGRRGGEGRGEEVEREIMEVAEKVGAAIGRLHEADVIHGDLTTSNMILRDGTHSLALIDFGLSYTCKVAEDKAVDLYVLERAFLSTHPDTEKVFERIMSVYERTAGKGAKQTLARLELVRARGRKKLCFG
jgi:TP53 regulating kinase-like protein